MTYDRGLLPLSSLGAANGAIAARAGQLRRRLRGAGFELHRNLARGLARRDDRGAVRRARRARLQARRRSVGAPARRSSSGSRDLSFAPQSRMAREDVLRNDHCFDAVIGAYTAYLWARDGWPVPEGCFGEDGWIIAPP